MKKRTVTLENGTVVDCGVQEFDDLITAMKNEDSKAIVGASVKVLLSSDALLDKLVKDMTKALNLFSELSRLEEIAKIRVLRNAERKRLDHLRKKLIIGEKK